MRICVTPAEAERDRPLFRGGKATTMRELFGERAKLWDGLCGHIVSQGPDDVIEPHFHETAQFQVFVAGSGRLGAHGIGVGSVHYSDAFGGYGPITPGADGCTYMTLRPSFDTSHHPLDRDRALARGRRARQKFAQVDYSSQASGTVTHFTRPDGAAVHQQRVAAGEPIADVTISGGSYWLVLEGTAIIDDKVCPVGTCQWIGEGEAAPAVIGGDGGALLVVLCFPTSEARTERVTRRVEGGLATA